MNWTAHWENRYQGKLAGRVSRIREHADVSRAMIRHRGIELHSARVLDVVDGVSVLVDELLTAAHQHPAMPDIAEPSL